MKHEELAYVVDGDDNVITTKKRGEITPDERVRIVSIWIENDKDEVLIAKRASTMSLDPGLWGPSAAGGVKVGSSYEQTAVEEVSEEVGLDVSAEQLTSKGMMLYETRRNGKRMCAVFSIQCNWSIEKFTIEPSEVDEIKWIAKNELARDIRQNPHKYLESADMWEKYFR